MAGAARPDEPDPQSGLVGRSKMLRELGTELRIRFQVRKLRGNRSEVRAEDKRQRHQRAMPLEVGKAAGARDDLNDAAQRMLGEAPKFRWYFENYFGAARRNHRYVAKELQRVAKSLLGVQKDTSAVDRLAEPLRLREVASRVTQHFGLPAIFVVVPTGREISVQQMHQPDVVKKLDAIRFCGERAAIFRGREIGSSSMASIERVDEVSAIPSAGHGRIRFYDRVWLQSERLIVCVECATIVTLVEKHVTEIAVRA